MRLVPLTPWYFYYSVHLKNFLGLSLITFGTFWELEVIGEKMAFFDVMAEMVAKKCQKLLILYKITFWNKQTISMLQILYFPSFFPHIATNQTKFTWKFLLLSKNLTETHSFQKFLAVKRWVSVILKCAVFNYYLAGSDDNFALAPSTFCWILILYFLGTKSLNLKIMMKNL